MAGGLESEGYPWLGVVSFPDGSSVITSGFCGSITFGEGEANETSFIAYDDPSDEISRDDIFIAKYNPNGTLAWAKREGGINGNATHAISMHSDDSFVIGGRTWGSATFGLGEPNETTLMATYGENDPFLARYNPDGTLAWARLFSTGTGLTEIGDVTFTGDSSTFLTGHFTETTTFGAGQPNETVLTAQADDILVAKCNSDGTLAWVKSAGSSTAQNIGNSVSVEGNYGVVTGFFGGNGVFSPGEPCEISLSSYGQWDIFVAKYKL